MKYFHAILKKIHQLLAGQCGLDPLRLVRAVQRLPRFCLDLHRFRKSYTGELTLMPCLHDCHEEAGITQSEYFWQDLLVARWIFEAQPMKHVDIGSRIDGFVAHVASYREIEVLDVRPIRKSIPGVVFKQMDLMQPITMTSMKKDYCDSLSCLHALEHFGLGRYGDQIDPQGYEKGIANMALLLQPGGKFYLSTPIGKERVAFNANWVFDPRTIIKVAKANALDLSALIVFYPSLGVQESCLDEATLKALALKPYNLGIFVFVKRNT
jgi:hypothetical protein